jgi:hypothetical protein
METAGSARGAVPGMLPASGVPRFDNAVMEAFELVKWYAREHVILCLSPPSSLGAIGVFISQASVMVSRRKPTRFWLTALPQSLEPSSVCSCTVLPLLPEFGGWEQAWVQRALSLFRTGHQCPGHRFDS